MTMWEMIKFWVAARVAKVLVVIAVLIFLIFAVMVWAAIAGWVERWRLRRRA